MSTVRLQPLTRAKVASLGDVGRAWHADLPRVLDGLAGAWGLTLGRGLPGGSASYVCAAQAADGSPRVVKVVLPDPELADETTVLAAAQGRGYVLLHAHEPRHRALLLERLGVSSEVAGGPVEGVLDTLVDTLAQAWRLPLDAVPDVVHHAATGGGDRAAVLAAVLSERQERFARPCDPAALAAALAAADRLSAGDDPAAHVVVHGDPHPGNVLRVLADRPGAPGGHVLIDPDGWRGDPAHDVGVTLRDWSTRLTGADAAATHEGWVRHAAERAGLDAGRVRDWAFLERVSTGLYVLGIGAERLGRRFLDSAAALVS